MRCVTCGPSEILIISGPGYEKPKTITGGRVWVWSCIQKWQKLSLNVMTLTIESPRIYTKLGVPITVTGVAQVKISKDNDELLETACELFADKSVSRVSEIVQETLEAHQRAIMGNMTVEEIYQDRKKFADEVFNIASKDMISLGMVVVSYTVKDITDEVGYLDSLGKARTAQVIRDARIGEAIATMEATKVQAETEQQRVQSKLKNETEIARAKRDFDVKKATYDKEIEGKKAETAMAYQLQAVKTRQTLCEEKMKVKIIERERQIDVQNLEVSRKQKQLEATVVKPAEAEKFKMEQQAMANKTKIIKEAEAEAQMIRLSGEAQAYSEEIKGKAEAEQMIKKAEAWGKYQNAAKLEMVLKMLPALAAECANPLTNCDSVKFIGSSNSALGAKKITEEVVEIIQKMPELVNSLTGFNLTTISTVH